MKKRLLKALKFVCLSALCGIGMAFFVDMVSEIAYNSASVSFSIMCMITVIVFSLLVFFVFFNNRKYETGEKFISLFITYCVMAIFMLSLFPLVYRINGGPLEAAVYNAHFKSAKMMFLTFIPVSLVFLLLFFIVYEIVMSVRYSRLMKAGGVAGEQKKEK